MKMTKKVLGYAVTKDTKYHIIEISLVGQIYHYCSWKPVTQSRVIKSYNTIEQCWAFIDAMTDGRPPELDLLSRSDIFCSVASLSVLDEVPEPDVKNGHIVTLTDYDDWFKGE